MYKPYSYSTLMSMTKKQIIDQLRVAEHNFFATEQNLNQQVENVKDWEPVVHGHWYFADYAYFICSACGGSYYNGAETTEQAKSYLNSGSYFKYCPHCGAKMDDAENG